MASGTAPGPELATIPSALTIVRWKLVWPEVGGLAILLLLAMLVIGCSGYQSSGNVSANPTPSPTPSLTPASGALDFLGGAYDVPFLPALGDIYANGLSQPLGTTNDGFGLLTPGPSGNPPPGLETLIFPPADLFSNHRGRANRDIKIGDFDNDGFPDIVSNTYSCVDPLNPDDIARVYKNNGDGTFTEVIHPFQDSNGNSIDLRGRGETIVVADFNNDGFLDIFIPYYPWVDTNPATNPLFNVPPGTPPTAYCPNASQSYLLLGDGTGHFRDVADAAGVSSRDEPENCQIEGAQAVDFYNNGLIDLYAGSQFFINTGIRNGIPIFIDQAAALGLPNLPGNPYCDEGAKFIDAYNDGHLALLLNNSGSGPTLLRFDGSKFTQQAFPTETYDNVNGINAFDINNDGLDDILVNGGDSFDPKIFINTGSTFQRVFPLPRPFTLAPSSDPDLQLGNGIIAFADVNNDGKADVFYSLVSIGPEMVYFINNTDSNNPYFVVELLGPNGEQNQHGRVVQVSPQASPQTIYTRVVDSGSGYLSQNQYPLLIGTRFDGPHTVDISLPQPGATAPNQVVQISFTILPGQKAQVFAPSPSNPQGMVEIVDLNPTLFDPALAVVVL